MAFRDLEEFLVVEPLELPIRGKLYRFPGEISARAWLLVQRLGEKYERARRAREAGRPIDPEEEVLSDLDEGALRSEMFGDAQGEMIADNLTSEHMKRVFYVLIAFHLSGREAAEAVWNQAGELKAPNREVRRAEAKSTRSRGSHAG